MTEGFEMSGLKVFMGRCGVDLYDFFGVMGIGENFREIMTGCLDYDI